MNTDALKLGMKMVRTKMCTEKKNNNKYYKY